MRTELKNMKTVNVEDIKRREEDLDNLQSEDR